MWAEVPPVKIRRIGPDTSINRTVKFPRETRVQLTRKHLRLRRLLRTRKPNLLPLQQEQQPQQYPPALLYSALSVTKYHALLKEKQKLSSLAGINHPAAPLQDRFGDDYEDIVEYDDVEAGELEDKAPAPVSSSEDTPDPPLGSRRPRNEVPDASSPKRPRSDEEASPMLRALTAPRTDPPVRAPWMPTEAQIHDRFGASSPRNPILLYSCNSINDDDVAKEVDFELETQRRDYNIGLFHELRYYAAKKTSRKS
ncbi:hypothetical protein P3T76_006984 [Phytophthora citrophthora]|uniref:Uncharacterized protein n=1 Tax=Phytophthora citrophthora TaxID=4793 RepID=A0AAD9GNL0_9STRA|nr:hypothetical protein P3T76_006984 [Phytophthora citrophthora]